MTSANITDAGWIAMSRSLPEHPLVGFGQPVKPEDASRGAYSRAEAWLDLLRLASWKDGATVFNKGRKETLLTGQLMAGYSWLAKRWNWSVKTVRNFLAKLIGEDMIGKSKAVETETKKGNQTQIVTICNYSDYQVCMKAEGQAKGKQGASEGHESNKITKDRSPNGDSSIAAQMDMPLTPDEPQAPAEPKRKTKTAVPEEYSKSFAFFWALYPRREGKAAAFKSWDRLTLDQQRRAYKALEQQVKILEVRAKDARGNFCPLPATWINQGRFDDELPPAGPGGGVPTSVNGRYTEAGVL